MKLAATTLVESLVAMTIIAIAFSIALFTFLSVTKADNLPKRVKAHSKIRNIVFNTMRSENYLDEMIIIEGVNYNKTVEVVKPNGLLKLSINAVDSNGAILDTYNGYITANEKN